MTEQNKRRQKPPHCKIPTLSEIENSRIVELIATLTDDDGEVIRSELRKDDVDIKALAKRIATGSPVEILSKLALTGTTNVEWVMRPDHDYVGLPSEAASCEFHTGFEAYIRDRVGKRSDGFKAIFDALDNHTRPLIVETGCLRVPRNWEGDGQSTFQFDWYARERGGHVITIDANEESIASARRACSSATSTILNDSVAALTTLGAMAKAPVALLYLDSFDLDTSDPMPSAVHHAMEIMAARDLLGPGTIVCVDDFDVPPLGPGGKGLIVDQFLKTVRAEVIYSGYQKIWRLNS